MTTEIRGVREFNEGLRRWAKTKPREAVIDGQQYLATEFLRRVMNRSPVGTPESTGIPGYAGGRYKGNHRVAIGTHLSGELLREDPQGEKTKLEGNKVIDTLNPAKPFTYVWIGNTARHAWAIEHGHSNQALLGVYAVVLNEVSVLLLGQQK